MAAPASLTLQPTQLPLASSKSTSHLTSFSSPHPPLPSPILSRASSRVSFAPRPITSSKSASVLTSEPPNARRKSQNPSPSTPLRPALKSSATYTPTRDTANVAGEEWWLQTASTLTLVAAESKGQAWLATRSSSTSLANDDGDDVQGEEIYRTHSDDCARDSSNHHAQLSPLNPRYPPPSSPHSTSWRASFQVKESRSNSVMFSPLHHESLEEASEQLSAVQGPMFVDLANEEDERYLRRSYSEKGSDIDEEGEVRRLIRGRVGGWVDYFVGWMDFRGDELGEGRAEEGERNGEERAADGSGDEEEVEEREKKTLPGKKRREEKRGMKICEMEAGARNKINGAESDDGGVMDHSHEEGGVWKDTKWLLGVASKAIL